MVQYFTHFVTYCSGGSIYHLTPIHIYNLLNSYSNYLFLFRTMVHGFLKHVGKQTHYCMSIIENPYEKSKGKLSLKSRNNIYAFF